MKTNYSHLVLLPARGNDVIGPRLRLLAKELLAFKDKFNIGAVVEEYSDSTYDEGVIRTSIDLYTELIGLKPEASVSITKTQLPFFITATRDKKSEKIMTSALETLPEGDGVPIIVCEYDHATRIPRIFSETILEKKSTPPMSDMMYTRGDALIIDCSNGEMRIYPKGKLPGPKRSLIEEIAGNRSR